MSDTRDIRVEDKIDDISKRLSSIDITLAGQHEVIKGIAERQKIIMAEIEPLKSHVSMMRGAAKLGAVVAILAGILEGFATFFTYLRNRGHL